MSDTDGTIRTLLAFAFFGAVVLAVAVVAAGIAFVMWALP